MITIEIENADRIIQMLKKAPDVMMKWLEKANTASLMELQKRTVRGVVPYRTGALMQTFDYTPKPTKGLKFEYYPTREYAPYVYYGTSRGIQPNKYLDRILELARQSIMGHYDQAVEQASKELNS